MVVTSLSDLTTLRDAWHALVRQSPSATPFQTWEWTYGLAGYEARHIRLRVVVARNPDGAVVGIAPFCLRATGLPGLTTLEFIGSRAADYMDLIVLDAYRAAFIEYLTRWLEQNTEWSILHLRFLRPDTVRLVQHWGRVQVVDVCPYARLPDQLALYEATLPNQLRSIIGRKRRRLANADRLSFSVTCSAAQIDGDLAIFFDLHQKRQRSKGERGRFFDPNWRQTFGALSQAMFAANVLRLGILRLDGQPAASLYNLRFQGREYFYLAGMDPDLAQHSPGSLLHHWMIGQAIQDGVQVYDFLRGNDPYKHWWANAVCEVYEVVRARSLAADLLWQAWQRGRRAVYRSHLIKAVYHATVGRFQTPVGKENHVS